MRIMGHELRIIGTFLGNYRWWYFENLNILLYGQKSRKIYLYPSYDIIDVYMWVCLHNYGPLHSHACTHQHCVYELWAYKSV